MSAIRAQQKLKLTGVRKDSADQDAPETQEATKRARGDVLHEWPWRVKVAKANSRHPGNAAHRCDEAKQDEPDYGHNLAENTSASR